MKTRLTLILLLFIYLNTLGQAIINMGPFYQSGNYIVLVGGTKWQNDGTMNLQPGSEVRFSGDTTQEIDGINTTAFANLRINNSSTYGVVVKRNIQVLGTLTMQQGYLDLKNNEVDLSTTGLLTGETETSRVRATDASWNEGGGTGRLKATRTNPTGNVAGLGLTFTPSTNMGSTVIYRGHNSQTGANLNTSIFRYFEIHPTTYATLNINPFSYFDAELNGITPESDLKIVQLMDNIGNWQPQTTTLNTSTNQAVGSTTQNSLNFIKLTLAKSACLMAVTANVNNPVCQNDTLSLSVNVTNGNGNLTYNWTGPNGFSSTQANPQVIHPSSMNNGTYYVTVVDEYNCSATSQVNVNVLSAPELTVTSNSPLCTGQDLQLTSSNAVSWQWSGPNGWTSNVQNPVISGAQLQHSGTYTVTITDANGCTATDQITITVHSLPVVEAHATSTEICEGSQVTLYGSGANSYVWNNGVTNNVPFVPTTTQTYTVTGTDANGCTATDQITITVNQKYVFAETHTICDGSSYTWHGNTYNTSGTYYDSLTTQSGCDSIYVLQLVIAENPNISISANDTVIIIGNSVTLTANGADTYQWVPTTALSCTNCNAPVANPTETTTYCVVGTNNYGCKDTACITIHVDKECGEMFIPVGI